MTASTEWVKGPFKAMVHGGQGAAINGWFCQDTSYEEMGFFLLGVRAGGWVARSIPQGFKASMIDVFLQIQGYQRKTHDCDIPCKVYILLIHVCVLCFLCRWQ